MRISLLLEREPFGKILAESLSNFWGQFYQSDFDVRWYQNRSDLRSAHRDGGQIWLGNIYLNALFTPNVNTEAFEPIRQEFSRSLHWWKRPLQSIYVDLATSSRGSRPLSQVGLKVYPAVPDAQQLLILGGNHKIRILNKSAGLAWSVLKAGFKPAFFHNEIKHRKLAQAEGVPVPPLVEVADDSSWFAEQYVCGTPINRLADLKARQAAVCRVLSALEPVYCETRSDQLLADYVAGLSGRINNLAASISILDQRLKKDLDYLVAQVTNRIKSLPTAGNGWITTTLSHGDFQPANIIAAKDQEWLIDWEYSAQRQAGYDILVYTLESRFPTRLADRLSNFIYSPSLNEVHFLPIWQSIEGRILAVFVFILEELSLRLEENSNPLLFKVGNGLESFAREALIWLSNLN